ncbi:hypothetical protein FRC98_13455 [Lujinxingia vulgaris]|uniref:YD repeat-containing protein n=1 Tax=Lujinxingia vulgaris TaxID=2600176 RepID=A0A5C6X2Z1_9DELT|nr:hypothetical protein [Lujinxingia vulgaris]TXD36124.1 hypothetical protein FRC98_13455 [Lujinxingia vulgaris]
MNRSPAAHFALLTLLAGLAACGPAPLPPSPDTDWNLDEPTPPAEPAAPTCLPQAEASSLQPPPEFTGSLPDCQVPALPVDNFPAVTCDEHSLTLINIFGTTTWHFADPQGSRIVLIEFQDALASDDVTVARTWTFDDRERLIHESQVLTRFVGPPQITELTHSYEDDRLISIELLNDNALTRTLFDYDDEGRLTRATRTFPDDSHESASWIYHAGRPVELIRERNDEALLHMRWNFSPEGHLQAMHVDADIDATAPALLDSYAAHPDWPHLMGLPSNDGAWSPLPHSDEQCSPVPTALTHGYPAADVVYMLLGPAPQLDLFHVSTAYQGYGLFLRFGLDYWVGHDGAGFAWPAAFQPGDHWQTSRHFDTSGHMVREDILRLNEGQLIERAERRRELRDGRILSDRLERTLTADAHAIPTRTLNFDYHADGRLSARTLTSPDGTILQRAVWHLENNRLTEHHVDSQLHQPHPTDAPYRLDDTTEATPTGRFTLTTTEHHYWLGHTSPPQEFTRPAQTP